MNDHGQVDPPSIIISLLNKAACPLSYQPSLWNSNRRISIQIYCSQRTVAPARGSIAYLPMCWGSNDGELPRLELGFDPAGDVRLDHPISPRNVSGLGKVKPNYVGPKKWALGPKSLQPITQAATPLLVRFWSPSRIGIRESHNHQLRDNGGNFVMMRIVMVENVPQGPQSAAKRYFMTVLFWCFFGGGCLRCRCWGCSHP